MLSAPPLSSRFIAGLAYAAELVGIALVYVAVARLSLMFASINPSASPIWPPAGLALGLVLLRGYGVWPAILVGAVVANALTAGTPATSLAIGAGNTLEAVVGAAVINTWAGGRRAVETPPGLAKFAAAVGFVGTPISATVGVVSLALAGFAPWANFAAIWTTWWLGDLAGSIVIAPLILLWAPALWPPALLARASAEMAPVAALAVAVGLVAYSPLARNLHASGALAFLALVPLMWAALRGSPRQTAATATLLSGFAVWGVLSGAGPFEQRTLNESFLLLIAFVGSITLPSLALSAALQARTEALKLSKADLAETREQLFQAQKMEAIGQLAGGVAHDFNNALAIVVGNLDLLLRRLPSEDAKPRRLAANALSGARRAVALSHSLLAFSRRQRMDARATDANARIRDLVRLLAGAIGETRTIRMELAPDLWPVHVDPIRLDSALVNLVVNARDAMPEGGELVIETSNRPAADGKPSWVVVTVRDSGTGMSEEVLAKALEPFFTTKGAGQGTGLGLSQVREFIEQAGGRIELESRLGEGTTVRLFAPRASVDAPRPPLELAGEPHAQPAPSLAAPVLVVEDDAAVRDFACAALGEIGYRALAANGARAGLELLAQHPDVGLILTDVVMPGLDGRGFAQAARRTRPDLPVIFMTGYAPQGLDPDALLLAKPFTAAELAAKMSEALA